MDLGSTVIFSNTDNAAHTFTSGTPGNGPSGQFDSGLVVSGATYQVTVKDWGTINYFCMVHPWMKGVLVVGNSIVKSDEKSKINVPIQTNEIEKIKTENQELKNENLNLKLENQELKRKIDSQSNIINDLQKKIESLNQVLMEQVKVIFEWVKSR